VQSETGRGTIVTVLFPASERSAVGPPTKEPLSRTWRGSGTVLVVDDEVAVLEFARRVLESAGFEVVTAEDGHRALEIFARRSDEFAAVLLDLTMPRLSGEDTLLGLREIREDVPVILSSGYNEQDVTRRFATHALSGFLQKPYRPADLLSKVRTLLDPATD
jgi:CheY-like chemotaxis protein